MSSGLWGLLTISQFLLWVWLGAGVASMPVLSCVKLHSELACGPDSWLLGPSVHLLRRRNGSGALLRALLRKQWPDAGASSVSPLLRLPSACANPGVHTCKHTETHGRVHTDTDAHRHVYSQAREVTHTLVHLHMWPLHANTHTCLHTHTEAWPPVSCSAFSH
ncbi:unnamed protein product [Rangifer tarandus platyrhynchus]|uniref:Uncharacterized protein n=2 Tax=Rangifer tarandus platyrhynchus TaxID=3082113 RepID=A0ABN8ZWJ3_RANTA|nr:unnamed protein product [Rangifer tarandus platyrhynchus]